MLRNCLVSRKKEKTLHNEDSKYILSKQGKAKKRVKIPVKKDLQDNNQGMFFHHSVHNLLSSCLLPNNANIKTHTAITAPVVLYRCETLSLKLWDEHKVRVFKKRA